MTDDAELGGLLEVLTRAGFVLVEVHQRLRVPTLFVFGRQDHYWNVEILALTCREPSRYADEVEFAHVEGASHFITDDNPAAVARLAAEWFTHAA